MPWPIVIAGFVDVFSRHLRGRGSGVWAVTSVFGWTPLGVGLGTFVAALSSPGSWLWPALFIATGAAFLASRPITLALTDRWHRHQEWARMNGVAAPAVLTR